MKCFYLIWVRVYSQEKGFFWHSQWLKQREWSEVVLMQIPQVVITGFLQFTIIICIFMKPQFKCKDGPPKCCGIAVADPGGGGAPGAAARAPSNGCRPMNCLRLKCKIFAHNSFWTKCLLKYGLNLLKKNHFHFYHLWQVHPQNALRVI